MESSVHLRTSTVLPSDMADRLRRCFCLPQSIVTEKKRIVRAYPGFDVGKACGPARDEFRIPPRKSYPWLHVRGLASACRLAWVFVSTKYRNLPKSSRLLDLQVFFADLSRAIQCGSRHEPWVEWPAYTF
mmetsp:Transcript_2134/g.14010  ORF Transcript_2134/g.14010 Transcript_2134/m.14010 type:complete len:130 (+) Transcript_2134:1707-2096(+)